MGVLTLDAVRAESAPHRFPQHVLKGCESALVLFAAAFHGRQDAVWMADAGLKATCVDTDRIKLHEMKAAYPARWKFVEADAFLFARDNAELPPQWDVVSLDPWSSLFQRVADALPLWCSLARRAVLLGTGVGTDVVVPEGWRVSEVLERSGFKGGVYWTVLEREDA